MSAEPIEEEDIRSADEVLINARLKIDQPEAEANLLKVIPVRDEIPVIEAYYSVAPPGGKNNEGSRDSVPQYKKFERS